MLEYVVKKPFDLKGKATKPGETVTLPDRQARYLRLEGKIKLAPAKSTTRKKPAKRED